MRAAEESERGVAALWPRLRSTITSELRKPFLSRKHAVSLRTHPLSLREHLLSSRNHSGRARGGRRDAAPGLPHGRQVGVTPHPRGGAGRTLNFEVAYV